MNAVTKQQLSVLIVEDDATLRDVLTFHLDAEGWAVRGVGSGDEAFASCDSRLPDIVVLDVMLPGLSGIEVCVELRTRYAKTPGVLMLTARDAEADVVMGLESGADDYVVKPCRPRELIARIKALARRVVPVEAGNGTRTERSARDNTLERGALSINQDARSASVGGRALKLTPSEFALLVRLAIEPGRVCSRLELLEDVFDTTHPGYARNVDCHVTRLRRKLEAAGLTPAPIATSHGAGYAFTTPEKRT